MTVLYLVKDYIEVVHKLIETSPSHVLQHSTYNDSLTIINFGLSTFKQFCSNFFSFEWLKQLWYFPIIVPEIATSMMEEISVLDGNFHNILSFLDKPVAVGNEIYGDYYLPLTCFEKIFTGLVNSLFIWIPTSTATFLCFRRFIMQGVEAGYAAALGTMAATIFWLASILFGLRFIVVPWMSLDLFRYWLGFLLLMKYFWDNRYAYKEVKHNSVFGKKTRRNIFGFHFLLALTEQTSLYPFLSNFSISSQSTLLEGFPSENVLDFSLIHFSYLLGIGIGSYSLINLLCWFWQDPAYRFYFWLMNKFKKLRVADIVRPVHLFFQSITVLFAFSSLPYFGIEYQITNPLGFLPNDQVFHQFKQTSFLTHPTSPAYYRSRLNFPRQKFFRYEDWAEYYHRNTPLDTSLYDQGAYRLYTMEDLSYGKDYEWMRRRSDKIKIRSRLKRLRWFPRNWANRLWEFTKTWSRRNVLWRNDILNMYQYSWDSKAPIIWNKLVFEEFFPTTFGQQKGEKVGSSLLSVPQKETEAKLFSKEKEGNVGKSFAFFLEQKKKPISTNWDSFWGPDPDWTSKFLWNQNSLNNKEKQLWFNWQSRLNLTDNDIWWKWLMTNRLKSKTDNFSFQTQKENKSQKADFWEPQKRLISIYSENAQKKELVLESSTLRKFVRKLSARFKLAQIDNLSPLNQEKKEIKNSFFVKPLNNGIWYNRNKLSSNSLKTLLLTPSLRDWTVFQTVMTNMNRMLWWRRLTTAKNQKLDANLPFSSKSNNLSAKLSYQFDPQIKLKILNGGFKNSRPSSSKKKEGLSSLFGNKKEENFVSNSVLNNFKKFVKTKKLSYSENKFAKIQNKYLEIQMKQNFLMLPSDGRKNGDSFFLPAIQKEKFLAEIDNSNKNMNSNSPNKTNLSARLEINNLKVLKPTLFLTKINKKKNNKFIIFKNKNKINVNNWSPISSVDVSSTLLHPLKYYLHKEQNFKRKLSFYGVKNQIFSKSMKDSSLTSFSKAELLKRKKSDLSTSEKNLAFSSSDFVPQNFSTSSSTNLFTSTYRPDSRFKSYPGGIVNQNQNWNSSSLFSENQKFPENKFSSFSFEKRKTGRTLKKNNYREDKNLSFTKNKNKLPIFNFYLKTYFQTYKKTKLYVLNTKMKRQLGMGASARRKGRDYSNKLLKRSKILSNTPWIRQWIDQSGFLARRKRLETWIARQHYDPNELWSKIMKVDVDLFMNRQPSYYFLTNTEEKLLHLRRFLLFEHYDSLRWYTYMTNYRTMKNTIGGTKSFTNRIYNQQFKGTFHKVRHLFSLTPSSSNGSLLKFDRPLYNLEKTNQSPLTSQAHEELQNFVPDLKKSAAFFPKRGQNFSEKIPMDLIEKSTQTLQQSIWENNLIRKNYISFLLEQKNYDLLTKYLVSNTLYNSESMELNNSVTPFKQVKTEKLINNSIKTNLQTKLMISLFKKRQKWTRDYKRASEKLWKKWKLRSKLIPNKTLYLLSNDKTNELNLPQFRTQLYSDQKQEKIIVPVKNFNYSGENVAALNKKFLQIIKLKKLTAIRKSPHGASAFFTEELGSPDLKIKKSSPFFTGETWKKSEAKTGRTRSFIFNNNIFTKKMIQNIYKNSHPKKSSKSPNKKGTNSFLEYKLQNKLDNRFYNTSSYNFGRNFKVAKHRKSNEINTKLLTQQNLQLYQKNLIRRERSNIQNSVFMKKFLLNDYTSPLTRSQIRPLPGKRTKALYEKSSAAGYYSSNLIRKNNPFLSSINDIDGVAIRAYKNRKWVEAVKTDNNSFKEQSFMTKNLQKENSFVDGKKIVVPNFAQNSLAAFTKLPVSKLNKKWKLFLSNITKSPKLVSGQMDQTLETKMIKDQNLMFLTNAITDNISTNQSRDLNLGTFSHLKKEIKTVFLMNEKSAGTILEDSSVFKNFVRQKLTKSILSKQKIINSLEKPTIMRITKSLRKRQQDRIVRSLLKRHLNLKSRRKLFVKTKEINNQRMSLDRKYEIEERIFLNKISYFAELKQLLDLNNNSGLKKGSLFLKPSSYKENLFKEKKEFVLTNKNLLKLNGERKLATFSNLKTESETFTNSKNLVDNFVSWLSLSNNKNLDNLSPLTEVSWQRSSFFDKKRSRKINETNQSSRLFSTNRDLLFLDKNEEKQTVEKKKLKLISFFTQEKISGNILTPEILKAGPEQSYLSSIKRSSLFINKMLKNNQNNLFKSEAFEKLGKNEIFASESYLNSKLKQNFVNLSLLENEKNILRRSLRKFIFPNSMPSFLFEKMKRGNEDQLYKLTRKYSGKVKPVINATTRKNSFVNNFLLKNWLRLKDLPRGKKEASFGFPHSKVLRVVSDSNINTKTEIKEKNNPLFSSSVFEKISQKNSSKEELINLNKYIIFARTNQNKLSRQQIRKKLKKRRIIRLKRNERLKTLRDHPLKFRSEQVQTFYNIRDSLKKWKTFSFISSKVKYNKTFWEGYNNRHLLSDTFGQNPTNTNLNENLESQSLNYKPLLNNHLLKSNEKNINRKGKVVAKAADFSSSSLPFLENTLSPFYTNGYLSFSDSFENKNILNSDLFYTLYQDIFINSPGFNNIELKSKSLDFSFQTDQSNQLENSLNSKLLVNNTNMPFYAGWDDSVRKFVLTNRLLTRKEAGYESSNIYSSGSLNENNTNNVVFSSWPLKGKNAATTLFSQFPFMTAPETNLNNSDKQIRVVKAGTKYIIEELTNSSKFNKERKFDKKWLQKNKKADSDFSPNINFKKNKRIKTIIKSLKNDEQIGIRQPSQVISNLATATSRKTARRALFSSRPWRSKKQTTKAILSSLSQKDNQSSLNFRKNPKLFLSLNSKKEFIDNKLSSKLLLLRNLRHGNRSQTKLAYLRRLQNFIRPTGSAWKTNLNLSRRKKQRIKQSHFFSSRFSVRKRKKRGNNKNPRLRGDKNYKKTKRQYRQKLYLRPKNKPLRRRSLGVAFQNKLNYWRRQYQMNKSQEQKLLPFLSNNQNLVLKDKVQLLDKQNINCLSINSYCLNDGFAEEKLSQNLEKSSAFFPKRKGKILFSQNLQQNLVYSQKDNEWSSNRRPRKLYRSLFKNPSRQNPILYSTLPGHSRSIPIIKNLPLPGSSVKTLNRIIKWSSADGAARFYRVNLSYGWAMELFLKNLHEKIKSKNNYSINGKKSEALASAFPLIKEYLSQLVQTNKNKFSSSRVFKRRFYKLRQLSYTMSLRLYDRWFFYYYKTGNSAEESNGNFDFQEKNQRRGQNLSTLSQNNFNNKIKQMVLPVPLLSPLELDLSQFKHIKQFLTFHLNENQSNFRSYLKNLRTTSYLKTQNITTEVIPELNKSAITENSNKIENDDSTLLENARTKDFDGLESFKLISTGKEEARGFSAFPLQEAGLGKSDLPKSGQFPEDKMNIVKSNKTLLKKEKKYAEDRFFFAQFNKPPLVDDSRLTLENNRHFPLNGGFVWPGDYLRLKTILLPKEMKDSYLLEKKNNFNSRLLFLGDKKKEKLKGGFEN